MIMKFIVLIMIYIATAVAMFGCASKQGNGLYHEYYKTYPTQEADR